jgi:hypothetical protein
MGKRVHTPSKKGEERLNDATRDHSQDGYPPFSKAASLPLLLPEHPPGNRRMLSRVGLILASMRSVRNIAHAGVSVKCWIVKSHLPNFLRLLLDTLLSCVFIFPPQE